MSTMYYYLTITAMRLLPFLLLCCCGQAPTEIQEPIVLHNDSTYNDQLAYAMVESALTTIGAPNDFLEDYTLIMTPEDLGACEANGCVDPRMHLITVVFSPSLDDNEIAYTVCHEIVHAWLNDPTHNNWMVFNMCNTAAAPF